MWPIYLPFFSCLKNTVKYFLQSSHKFSFCFCLCLFVFLPSSPTSSSLFPFLFRSFLSLSPSPLSLLPSSLPSLFLLSDLNYRKILLLALTFFFSVHKSHTILFLFHLWQHFFYFLQHQFLAF